MGGEGYAEMRAVGLVSLLFVINAWVRSGGWQGELGRVCTKDDQLFLCKIFAARDFVQHG